MSSTSYSRRQRMTMAFLASFFLPVWIALTAVVYVLAWLIYLRYAQTDAPQSYPFLPYHPIRVYKVVSTYAELQFDKLMRLVPLFGHFARFQLTQAKKTDTIKNLAFGRSDNKLDIYIPNLPDTDVYAADNSSTSGLGLDDNESDHTVESHGCPVIIYVYGGAWDSGHKSIMMPMAQNLANQGYIVVVPDYTRYPKAKIEEMVLDIQDAVQWTTENAARYGGDPTNIYLMGSGAGAHLATLTIVHDAVEQLGGIAPPNVQGDTSTPIVIPAWPEPSAVGSKSSEGGLTASAVANGGKPLLKQRIQGMILFSGVYDITFYYAYLHKRGIEEVSAMPRVMHRSANNYLACSPSWILSNASMSLEQPELLEQVLPNSFLIIHGEQDRLIPAHSSQTLFNLLCAAEIPNIKFKIYTGQGHLDPAIDLILPTNAITSALLNDVAEVVKPANGTTGRGSVLFDNGGESTHGSGTGVSTPNKDEDSLRERHIYDNNASTNFKDVHDEYAEHITASLLRNTVSA